VTMACLRLFFLVSLALTKQAASARYALALLDKDVVVQAPGAVLPRHRVLAAGPSCVCRSACTGGKVSLVPTSTQIKKLLLLYLRHPNAVRMESWNEQLSTSSCTAPKSILQATCISNTSSSHVSRLLMSYRQLKHAPLERKHLALDFWCPAHLVTFQAPNTPFSS
jgi:hypothetical protein